MVKTNQESVQQSLRDMTGVAYDYNGDWWEFFDLYGIADADFNGRMVAWLQSSLGSTATNINDLKNEYAAALGVYNWNSITKIAPVAQYREFTVDGADTATITDSSGAVDQIDDKYGNGLSTTQVPGAKQPTTNATTQNGKNLIDYDGGDSLILPSALYLIPNGNNTVIYVAKRSAEDATNDTVFCFNEGGGGTGEARYYSIFSSVAGDISFRNGTAVTPGIGNSGNTNTNFQVVACRREGTTQAIAVDNGTETTNASGTSENGVDRAFLGTVGDTTNYLTGNIAQIDFFSGSLTTEQRTAMYNINSRKWGI